MRRLKGKIKRLKKLLKAHNVLICLLVIVALAYTGFLAISKRVGKPKEKPVAVTYVETTEDRGDRERVLQLISNLCFLCGEKPRAGIKAPDPEFEETEEMCEDCRRAFLIGWIKGVVRCGKEAKMAM